MFFPSLYVIAWVIATCRGHNVLVVFPFPSPSHSYLGNGIVRHLLEAGNEVTYITPFPWKSPPSKLTQVDVSSVIKGFKADEVLNLTSILEKTAIVNDQSFVIQLMSNVSREILEHENVQTLLLDRKQKFEAVVVEWMFTDVYSGFSQVYSCPYILFTPFEHNTLLLDILDEYPNPAFTPSGIHLGHLPPFTFTGRVSELYLQLRDMIFKRLFFHNHDAILYQEIFEPILKKLGKPIYPYDEVKKNVSLALVNTHVSISHAARIPRNYLSIGGFHIDTDVKPLPEDLQKLLDNTKDGVIYFSMGSNLKSKFMPDRLKNNLLKMFGSLKQTVLWKFEKDIPNVPKNVKILQWAPQASILAHPNCVLFITHGGLLSTTETIHFGKPVIGVPAFADQFTNVDRAVFKGFAKRVDLSYTMADDLKIAIEEMLTDPKYKLKAKELSFIYHHRPVPPGKLLAHGVEHVIMTQGAPHLRSPASLTPWYQKLYLDLAAIILAVISIFIFLLKKVIALLFVKKKVQKDGKKKRH